MVSVSWKECTIRIAQEFSCSLGVSICYLKASTCSSLRAGHHHVPPPKFGSSYAQGDAVAEVRPRTTPLPSSLLTRAFVFLRDLNHLGHRQGGSQGYIKWPVFLCLLISPHARLVVSTIVVIIGSTYCLDGQIQHKAPLISTLSILRLHPQRVTLWLSAES